MPRNPDGARPGGLDGAQDVLVRTARSDGIHSPDGRERLSVFHGGGLARQPSLPGRSPAVHAGDVRERATPADGRAMHQPRIRRRPQRLRRAGLHGHNDRTVSRPNLLQQDRATRPSGRHGCIRRVPVRPRHGGRLTAGHPGSPRCLRQDRRRRQPVARTARAPVRRRRRRPAGYRAERLARSRRYLRHQSQWRVPLHSAGAHRAVAQRLAALGRVPVRKARLVRPSVRPRTHRPDRLRHGPGLGRSTAQPPADQLELSWAQGSRTARVRGGGTAARPALPRPPGQVRPD